MKQWDELTATCPETYEFDLTASSEGIVSFRCTYLIFQGFRASDPGDCFISVGSIGPPEILVAVAREIAPHDKASIQCLTPSSLPNFLEGRFSSVIRGIQKRLNSLAKYLPSNQQLYLSASGGYRGNTCGNLGFMGTFEIP
jgi:hypothetical protein